MSKEAEKLARDCDDSADIWANEIDTRRKAAALLRRQAEQIRELREALAASHARDVRNTCQHEETHRGGAIWEICDQCGQQWADDEGGKPEWRDPPEWAKADAALSTTKEET